MAEKNEFFEADFVGIENQRKSAILLYVFGIILDVIGGLVYVFSNVFDFGINPIFIMIGYVILILAGVVMIIIASVMKKKMTTKFKTEYLVPHVAKKYPGVTYDPFKGLPRSYVESLRMFKRPDRYTSEDMFSGTIAGVKFISSDVCMEEEHVQNDGNGGTRTYYKPYFKGRIAAFEFNKSFNDSILVSEGGAYVPSGAKKVELESIDFNKKFKTYAKDALNAFYILTPEIILAILEIEKQNPGKIAILFHDNKMVVCINNFVDTFEIKLSQKIDDKFISIIDRDINMLLNLVTQMKLNKNVFKE